VEPGSGEDCGCGWAGLDGGLDEGLEEGLDEGLEECLDADAGGFVDWGVNTDWDVMDRGVTDWDVDADLVIELGVVRLGVGVGWGMDVGWGVGCGGSVGLDVRVGVVMQVVPDVVPWVALKVIPYGIASLVLVRLALLGTWQVWRANERSVQRLDCLGRRRQIGCSGLRGARWQGDPRPAWRREGVVREGDGDGERT
jgi:hypothetical protein